MLVTLSVRDVTGLSKSDRADIKYYSRFVECEFSALVHMLNKDYIFSPWNYIGYTQLTANICSEALFVVIDVDHTSVSIAERLAELMAEDLQCIIASTSDSDNIYKYRVLIPLNRPVTPYEYRLLVTGIQSNGLIPDMDPVSSRPAQKYYSYANSQIVSNFIGSTLVVDDYIVDPQSSSLRLLEPSADVTDILHEFDSYQSATKGRRTRNLLHAAYKCLDYGLTDEQLERVINYVNSRFLIPKSQDEIQRRVIQFIKSQRKYI
jgi:hypothetical protein